MTHSAGYPNAGFGGGSPPPYPDQPSYGQPPYGQPPYGQPGRFRDIPANWGWAIVGVIFFWPVGIAAVKAAGRVLPALLDGDAQSAMSDSRRARKLGIIALCITLAVVVLYVAGVVVFFAAVVHSCQSSTTGC